MSPEQTSGSGAAVSEKSDIYSLGVVLLELLTGSHPDHRSSDKRSSWNRGRRAGTGSTDRGSLKRVPHELRGLLSQTLSTNPDVRPPAGALAARIHSYLQRGDVGHRPKMYGHLLLTMRRGGVTVAPVGVFFVLAFALDLREIADDACILMPALPWCTAGPLAEKADPTEYATEAQSAFAEARVVAIEELEERLALWDEMATQHPENLGFRRTITRDLRFLAEIRLDRSEVRAAIVSSYQAVEIDRDLVKREPANLVNQAGLWASLQLLGKGYLRNGQLGQALAAHEEALTIAWDLVRQERGDPSYQRYVAVSLEAIGDVRLRQGDALAAPAAYASDALAAYEKGLAIRQHLADLESSNPRSKLAVSVTLNRIADVRLRRGELPAALEAYEAGLAIRRDLAERYPFTRPQLDTWRSLRLLSAALLQGDQLVESLAAGQEALEIARDMAERQPGNLRYQRYLYLSEFGLASVLGALGDGEEAVTLLRRALSRNDVVRAADPTNSQFANDKELLQGGLAVFR